MITTDGTRSDRQFFIVKNHKTHKHDIRHTNKLIRQHCDFFFFFFTNFSNFASKFIPIYFYLKSRLILLKINIYSFDVIELKTKIRCKIRKVFTIVYNNIYSTATKAW